METQLQQKKEGVKIYKTKLFQFFEININKNITFYFTIPTTINDDNQLNQSLSISQSNISINQSLFLKNNDYKYDNIAYINLFYIMIIIELIKLTKKYNTLNDIFIFTNDAIHSFLKSIITCKNSSLNNNIYHLIS